MVFWCYVGLVLLVCVYVCVFDLWLVVLDMFGCLFRVGLLVCGFGWLEGRIFGDLDI